MTFWAKLLTVVVFILSLIFASMSVVLFGKRENYRAELEKTKSDYARDKDTLTRANAHLTEQVSQLGLEAAQAKDNADALDKIKASGKTEFHLLSDAAKKAWIAKLMPVHTEMQSRFGKDFLERIYKASGFTPPQS